jgi:hypothetical protein
MDPVTRGFLIFGAALGWILGIAVPPSVHLAQKDKLLYPDFALQSFFPFIMGALLFFGCLLTLLSVASDDVVLNPFVGGNIAILAIFTSLAVMLFSWDRAYRMAN